MKRGPKAQYVRIRIEMIEQHIGHTIAKGETDATAALRFLARQAGADPNETKIREYAAMYTTELERWRAQDAERAARNA